MRHDCGGMWPIDTGARFNVAFEIVGVQFDQAGNQEVATAVDRPREGRIATIHRNDPFPVEADRTANDFIFQHDIGISQHEVGHLSTCPELTTGWQSRVSCM